MVDGAPNHFARLKAGENKGLAQVAPPSETAEPQDEDTKDLGRMADQYSWRRQDWYNIDLSGQGLRVLTAPVFNYDFLKELYIASNKLTSLPAAIGRLGQLELLDASNNLLTDVPPELSMCVKLKQLLLFDNRIQTLPHELGSLFKLEMLGIEGNPLDSSMRLEIMENGTKALIHHLRETAPGMFDSPPARFNLIVRSSNASITPLDTWSSRRATDLRARDLQSVLIQHPL